VVSVDEWMGARGIDADEVKRCQPLATHPQYLVTGVSDGRFRVGQAMEAHVKL
jgi:hypothetical protein